MLLLTATTDKLQVITSSAATVDVHASYMDHTTATDDVVGGRQNTATSSATTTDIVASPGSGVVRNVKTLHIRNKHASLSCDVTVVYNQNGTSYQLHSATLRAGETLEYIEGVGFFTITTPTNPRLMSYALTSDHSETSTTPTEITGLSNLTGTGTFVFQYNLIGNNAATTTGFKLSANHDGTVTAFNYWVRWLSNTTAASDDVVSGAYVTAAGGVMSGFSARAKTTAGTGTLTDVDTAGGDVMIMLEGLMIVTVDGSLELWHGSDAGAASVIKAGSSLIMIRTGD